MGMTLNSEDRYGAGQGVSLTAVDIYMREVSWIQTEPLTSEEEAGLLRRVERAQRAPGNQHYALLAKHARDRLVEVYQPLVLGVARRFGSTGRARGMELLDLVSEGNIGLLRAIADYHKEVSFHGAFRALATGCVRLAMMKALDLKRGYGHIADDVKAVWRKVRSLREETLDGELLTARELAARLGVSVDRVYDVLVLERLERRVSLEALYGEDQDAEDHFDFVSLFESEVAEETARQAQLAESLQQALEVVLTPSQREVVRLKYRFDDGGTLPRVDTEVAALVGRSVSGVAQHRLKALTLLRGVLQPAEGNSLVVCDRPAPDIDEQECYTSAEAIAVLGLARGVFWRNVNTGLIPGYRLPGQARDAWRFSKQAIDALAAEMQSIKEQEYYTSKEVRQLFGLSHTALSSEVTAGRIPRRRLLGGAWVFPKQEIDALMMVRQAVSA